MKLSVREGEANNPQQQTAHGTGVRAHCGTVDRVRLPIFVVQRGQFRVLAPFAFQNNQRLLENQPTSELRSCALSPLDLRAHDQIASVLRIRNTEVEVSKARNSRLECSLDEFLPEVPV
jgi:hypothetical protein